MANAWKCDLCGEQGSDLGAYVALTARRRAHLKCYRDELAEQAVQHFLQQQEEAKADRERVEEDRRKAAEEAALSGLLALRAKGEALWTREDRIKLAEAKLICVHCGTPIGPGGQPRSGPVQKHCQKCYFASRYGEQQAAQGAAKSAASIAAVSEVLAGAAKAPEPAPAPQEPKKEEKPKSDRFNLIELE